jgi:hypothetical protein
MTTSTHKLFLVIHENIFERHNFYPDFVHQTVIVILLTFIRMSTCHTVFLKSNHQQEPQRDIPHGHITYKELIPL